MKTILIRSTLVMAMVAGASGLAVQDADASGASLVCESTGNGAFCDAYPKDAIGYSWTRSGPVTLTAAPPNSDAREIVCTTPPDSLPSSGSVTVVVTHPGGYTSTASRQINCNTAPW